jgi:hypothetical protein
MTWLIWLCDGWLASEVCCALEPARARSKKGLSGDAVNTIARGWLRPPRS